METYNPCYHESSFLDEQGRLRTLKIPVVQELVRQGLTHLPDSFKRFHHPTLTPSAFQDIPTINLALLKHGSDPTARSQELAKLAKASKALGLFLIQDHGIAKEVVEGAKEGVRGFFELSYEEKKACVGSCSDVDNMGYGKNFTIKSQDQVLDWVDRLTLKALPPIGDDEGLHVWPLKPSNFREAVGAYVGEARTVMDSILVSLAEALSLENDDVFLKNFPPKHSEIKLRANYYPPCPSPDLTLGLNPHSDPSALSVLCQFGSSHGLQVLDNNKEPPTWVTASWPQDQLLVIVGDLLEIMSNGLVQSTWHRAVPLRDVERGSIALFYTPPPKTLIEPLAADQEGEAYRKVVVEDYVKNYYKVSPTVEKMAINCNFAKLD